MIGTRDTFTLARTKLRSKRILLIITVVVSGLLFGVLSTALLVSTGITRSTQDFFVKALDGRYLVQVQANIPNDVMGYTNAFAEPSKELAGQLNAMQDAYIAKQKAIYDKHKLPFDKTSVAPILQADPFGSKDAAGNPIKIINRDSPVYQDYLTQKKREYIKTANNTITDLKKLAAPYGATAYYNNQMVSLQALSTYLKDGKEDLNPKKPNSAASYEDYLTSSVKDSTYTFADQTIIKRFIYPENDKRRQNTDAIPVVLTTQEIAKMFGKELDIAKRPNEPAAQVAWTKDLQAKSNGHVYEVCYRNASDKALIQKTLQTNTEIAEKRNDKTYTPPSLQYNLPTTPCGELTVKKDTRTALQKKEDDSKEAIQKDLGTYTPPERRTLKFQIVGSFTLADVTAQPQNATAYISYLLGPQYQNGSFIPRQAYDALPASAQHKDVLFQTPPEMFGDYRLFEEAGITTTIVSFPTLEAARDFSKQNGCDMHTTECKKPFSTGTYGSSYLAVDEISSFISKTAPIALSIAMAIATIVIWITMARVIIDSRRETAVFRALGAKRKDIASIYLLYSLLVALLIVLFMLIIGLVAASIIESLFGAQATDLAKVAYGVFDTFEPFRFIGIDYQALLLLAGSIFAISLVAAFPPLWRNVRRNPIRDMRDE